MSHSKTLNETAEECRRLQIKAAKQLRDVAKELRQKQKDLNIASVSFNAAGVAAGGLGVAGICLAPFTGGLSLGLLAAGGGLGVASGVGGISTSVAEWNVIGGLVEEADKILDKLKEKMGQLSEKLDAELKPMGLSLSGLIAGGGKFAGQLGRVGPRIARAIAIAQVGSNVGRTSVSLGNAAVAGGKTALAGAAKIGSKVGAVAGAAGGVLCVGLNIAGIVNDSINIHNDVSPAADSIEMIALVLEEKVREIEH